MNLTDGFDLIDPASLRRRAARPTTPGPRCAGTLRCTAASRGTTRPSGRSRATPTSARSRSSPTAFLNAPGHRALAQRRKLDRSEGVGAMRTIIEMDPPQHRSFRKVAAPWFTPRALGRIDAAVRPARARASSTSSRARPARASATSPRDVATAHPLRILSSMLGVPREEEPRILRLTNQLFADEDAELQRPGEDREQAIRELGLELFQLFGAHHRGPPQEPARRSRHRARPTARSTASRWVRSRPSATT